MLKKKVSDGCLLVFLQNNDFWCQKSKMSNKKDRYERKVFTPGSHSTTEKKGIKTNVEDLKRLELVQQGRGITGQSTTLRLLMLLSQPLRMECLSEKLNEFLRLIHNN